MPRRTNEFQEIIADIYRALTPMGATFQESAIVEEPDGTQREIDVLIRTAVAGSEISLAVECRDYNRKQSIEWVDSLIGKYQALPIDKVVAVSSSGFSETSIMKASRHRIQCLSATEAEGADWAEKFCRPWKSLHYEMRLYHLATYGPGDAKLTHTELMEDWSLKHDDALSEKLFPTIYKSFLEHYADEAKRQHDHFIASFWNTIPDGDKRYFEVSIETDATISPPGETYSLKRVLGGIGVTFRWEDIATNSRVLHDRVATRMDFGPANLTIVRPKDGGEATTFFRLSDPDQLFRTVT